MVKRGPVDRDDERASTASRANGTARSAPGEDHAKGAPGSTANLLHLQRRMGNRAVGQLLQPGPRSVQRAAGTPIVQRALPQHIDMFSLDLMADRHNALVKRVNTEAVPKIGRYGELAQALNRFDATAHIDAEAVQGAAAKIKSTSDKPGTQAIERSTEAYLKAYEEFEVAPTPEVERNAVAEAITDLETKLVDTETVQAEQEQSIPQDAVNAEKKRIEEVAKDVGTGVELTLKTIKALVTREGWADLAIDIAKEGSTKLTEWKLSVSPEMKAMEAKLAAAKQRVAGLKTLAAALEVQKAQDALAKAAAALERKMREIDKVAANLERAERDLVIDMRALGLKDAAHAVESRGAARRTSAEMLVALHECRTVIEGLLPEAVEVYRSFDALAASRTARGVKTELSGEQEAELESVVQKGKQTRTFLEERLTQIDANRAAVESGHYDKIYQPVQETLHQTQI
ncbi:hypothetical protein [Glycomyces sp. NPDC048151]|uniref:hypothetical protein n=1 Tax=Glycomyces sp. NPDC048151 TaxID=3364002 RepID=UPI003719DF6E